MPSVLVELLASPTAGRLDLTNLLLLDNAGITRWRVLYATGSASSPTLCFPLPAEVTLFLDRKRLRAGGVHKWTARRMRLVVHLLSRVTMTFLCSNAR